MASWRPKRKNVEQRDYLLREIEKIGAIFSRIRQILFGGKDNLAITLEQQFQNEKGRLLDETNFDIDKVLFSKNSEQLSAYLSSFKGINVANMEILAACFAQIGLSVEKNDSKKYLEKAYQLYELCNLKSGTYSFERDKKMKLIKQTLQRNEKEAENL